ncbi:competence/damage-inducible protein A [Gordonia sp. CPCC 205515]|uniref:competence/damage-inducible protein A n=1 Tax=Gordonia sp. CPCC 205515 TaxID=3140791 RepID=UPI003AF34548
MTVRAGIVVTGTEVLTGRVTDRNGPWVAQRLLEMGVDVAHITVCGDRPDDLTAQLAFLATQGVDLIITTGGLGPTADDLTVPTVAEYCGRPLELDSALESHIEGIIRRWQHLDDGPIPDALAVGITKQAMVPQGAESIPPVGTAPGVAIPPSDNGSPMPAVLILPGPPRELQTMWPTAMAASPVAEAIAGRDDYVQETIRAYGLSEADLAETLRDAESRVDDLAALEITTCIRLGEIDMVTRFPEAAVGTYASLVDVLTKRHGRQIFSTDGSTIDEQIARLLDGRMIATAESCTGGMVAARLTDRPGSSAYVLGGVVSYANEVKSEVLGVPEELLAEHGAVSEPVAAAMAEGVLRRLDVDVAVSTTGVAGPGGGTELKPVGTVWFGVAVTGQPTVTKLRRFAGDRATVRALATTAALHLVARTLRNS